MEELDIYNELAIDLVKNCKLNMFAARQIVEYLKKEQFLDAAALKEWYQDFYLGEEDNEV